MIYAYVAVALMSAAVSGVGVWRVQEWRHGSIEAARIRGVVAATDVRRLDINKAATKFEGTKAAAEVREIRIRDEVERVVEKPVYTNICLDDDGLRILRDDIASRHPGSQSKPTVPSPAHSDPANWQKRAGVGARSDPPL